MAEQKFYLKDRSNVNQACARRNGDSFMRNQHCNLLPKPTPPISTKLLSIFRSSVFYSVFWIRSDGPARKILNIFFHFTSPKVVLFTVTTLNPTILILCLSQHKQRAQRAKMKNKLEGQFIDPSLF